MIKLEVSNGKILVEAQGDRFKILAELTDAILNFFDNIEPEFNRVQSFTAFNLTLTDEFFKKVNKPADKSPDESLKSKTKRRWFK